MPSRGTRGQANKGQKTGSASKPAPRASTKAAPKPTAKAKAAPPKPAPQGKAAPRPVDETGSPGEAFYESLFHSSPAAMAVWKLLRDRRGKPKDLLFVDATDAFREVGELTDFMGRTIRELVPDYRDRELDLLSVCSRVIETGTVEVHEGHDSRTNRMFRLRVRPSTSEDHILAILSDITEEKSVAETLKKSLFMLDNIRDYPVWTDRQGNIVEVSEATTRALGYARDELLSMKVFDISPNVTPEFWEERWRLLSESRADMIETEHLTKSGARLPVELQTNLVTFDGHDYHCAFCRDITPRKRGQAALQRLRYSLDNMDDYPTWNDSEGRIIEVSESTCRHLGYTREELLSMTIFDINPDIDRKAWSENWNTNRGRDTFRIEGHHRTKSGETYPVEITIKPMVFDGVEYHCTFCRDITDRRQLEESLRLTQFSVERAPDSIFWLDEGGRFVFANRALGDLLGYSQEEIAAKRIWDVDPSITAESWPELWHRVKDSGPFVHEEVFRGRDDLERKVEISSNHLEFGGNEYGVTVARDITERKRVEESLRVTMLSVEQSPDMIHWVDPEGRIIYANLATCRSLGYSLDELQKMYIWELSPSLTQEVFRSRWARTTEGDVHLAEEVWRAKDGREYTVEISATNVLHEGRELGIGFVRDVTERNETVKALREREEQLRQSQKMEAVGRLAGGIAHDFNNVLTTIMGYSDLILSSPDLPEGSLTEDLSEIRSAAERARALTARILAFSRRQNLEPTITSLNDIVADTERLLSRTLGADVELRTSLEQELWDVELDEQQFVQVLLNLALNARDAMPEGGVLTITTANVELDEEFCKTHPGVEPGPHATMALSDTGVGMDEDTLARIFEPFYTTKPPGEGTGLGLSTVYGLVTQSKGHVEVRSQRSRGTTFTIYLPRAGDFSETGDPASRTSKTSGPTRTVMVVEDDKTFVGLTQRVLKRQGYDVISAADLDEARSLLDDKSIRIDALVIGLTPDESSLGDRVGEYAAIERPALPLLFMSTRSRDTMVESGRVEEKAAYLEKPFTAEELASQVRTCLGDG